MSDTRRVGFLYRVAQVGLQVTVLGHLLLATAPLRAQSSADIDALIAALGDSIKVTEALVNASRKGKWLALDDSLVVDGVTVLFPSTIISERDRESIREGIEQAGRSLSTRFGAGAERLLDGDQWSIWQQNSTEQVTFADGRGEARQTGQHSYPLPLASADVERHLLLRAGTRLLRRDPKLGAFTSGAFVFVGDERTMYIALVQLASSKSSVARRCAERSLRACRTILDARQAEQWYLPTDTVRGNSGPISGGVAASVVTVALELGGVRAIEAIGAPHTLDEPVAILAQAAGVTPDSLLLAWGARMREASELSARPTISFAAAAVAWWGLFLLVATRRRPR